MELSLPHPAAESDRYLPPGVSIKPRRLENRDFDSVPKYWLGSSPFASLQLDLLSIIIPEHEKFFIHTLKEYQDQLEDQESKDLVRGFIHQEATHYKVHQEYNATRPALGMNMQREEALGAKIFDGFKRFLPLRLRLSMTAFMEHFTACGAHLLLREGSVAEQMHPQMQDLWEWHAVEEIEHKAVAFDLFEQQGGNYFYRLLGALITTLFVGMWLLISGFRLLRDDRLWRRYNQLPWTEEELATQKITRDKLLRETKDSFFLMGEYFKPSFHPWKLDDSEFVKRFEQRDINFV